MRNHYTALKADSDFEYTKKLIILLRLIVFGRDFKLSLHEQRYVDDNFELIKFLLNDENCTYSRKRVFLNNVSLLHAMTVIENNKC
jgi:hypothetical protein